LNKHDILRQTYGYETFRPGQEGIVDHLIEGRNVLAVMPTGSGKSLCYQVPALVKGGLSIVVSPLVALMQDQVAALKLAGVAAETINSAASRDDNVAIWKRVALGEVRLLYLSPERLMTDRMIGALQKLPVSLIAIDEAHCISQWGASFRPEYDMLQSLKDVFPAFPSAPSRQRQTRRRGATSSPSCSAARRRSSSRASTGPTSALWSRPRRVPRNSFLISSKAAKARAASSMPCRGNRRRNSRPSRLQGLARHRLSRRHECG
jgi:Rad3-related DNA helicase